MKIIILKNISLTDKGIKRAIKNRLKIKKQIEDMNNKTQEISKGKGIK